MNSMNSTNKHADIELSQKTKTAVSSAMSERNNYFHSLHVETIESILPPQRKPLQQLQSLTPEFTNKQIQLVRVIIVSALASSGHNSENAITGLSNLLDTCNNILRARNADNSIRG